MVFFMGLAQRLRSFWLLPYLLGCWLLSLGVTVLLHTEEEKDAAASPSSGLADRVRLLSQTQETPGEHQNRWPVHPSQNGAIGYAPWPDPFWKATTTTL